jgi:hypothetical protein
MLALRALPCAAHTSSSARLLLAARPAGIHQQRRRRCAARAAPPHDGSGNGNDANDAAPLNDLLLANRGQPCPVPREQQPINELAQLAADQDFELARAPAAAFAARLARDFFAFFTVIGLPVSAFTFDLQTEPAQFVLAAACGSLFVVTVRAFPSYLVVGRSAAFWFFFARCTELCVTMLPASATNTPPPPPKHKPNQQRSS